jgi:ribosome-associated toxin RatA of RatAB toxin-antitoxin module
MNRFPQRIGAGALFAQVAAWMLCAAAAGAAPPLGLGEVERLERGDMVPLPVSGRGSQLATRSAGLIDAEPAQVWSAVRNCEHYDEFMPRMKHSVQQSRQGNTTLCSFEVSLPFPLSNLHSEVRSVEQQRPDGSYERSWSLVRGDYERNHGSWTLLPWGADGTHTLAIYEMDLKTKLLVPEFLVRRLQTSTLTDMFDALRRRVNPPDSH